MRHAIAMVSDFFYPVVGGVENHIFMLSAHLIRRGHKVIVITHSHPPDRTGIRHLSLIPTPGQHGEKPGLTTLKVYHIPFPTIASSATLPNFFTSMPYLRTILIRERITLVHGHGSLSSIAHEAILDSHLLGLKAVFTDHSLFGFDDAASILTNKLLVGTLRCVGGVICVSHTARENTVLRAHLFEEPVDSPGKLTMRKNVWVIPNAIVADQFTPSPSSQVSPDGTVTIAVISRLAYRKGVDLLVATAPKICERFPNVKFIVGGDGPKLIDLLQMREKYQLQDRIELLGPVKPSAVKSVLSRAQIFLNTSLTESFGIAILEAACAGLYVVTTRVGGVPEVLPFKALPDKDDGGSGAPLDLGMGLCVDPTDTDILQALEHAIPHILTRSPSSAASSSLVTSSALSQYTWPSVVKRTEAVYDHDLLKEAAEMGPLERMQRIRGAGSIAGWIWLCIFVVQCLFWEVLEWYLPRESIELAFDADEYEGEGAQEPVPSPD